MKPRGVGWEGSGFRAGDGAPQPGRQGRKKACPPAFFGFWVGAGLRAELAGLRRPSSGRDGGLSRQRREGAAPGSSPCACACELRRARVLSLAQCDVGRGGWSRELHFPPPSPSLFLPTNSLPPPPAQPPAAICITKARRSGEEERAGRVPVTRAPRRRSCGA